MPNWTHRLDIKDLHAKYKAFEITPQELGREVSQRLRVLIALDKPPIGDELKEQAEEIALSFKSDISDIDDYDSVLEELYDWADTELPHSVDTPFSQTPKLCWVKTF